MTSVTIVAHGITDRLHALEPGNSAGYNVSVINRRRSVPVVEGVCRH
jgi:hypothetical protein